MSDRDWGGKGHEDFEQQTNLEAYDQLTGGMEAFQPRGQKSPSVSVTCFQGHSVLCSSSASLLECGEEKKSFKPEMFFQELYGDCDKLRQTVFQLATETEDDDHNLGKTGLIVIHWKPEHMGRSDLL